MLLTVCSWAQTSSALGANAFARNRNAVLQHNATSCNTCHSIPSEAGSSNITVDASTKKLSRPGHEKTDKDIAASNSDIRTSTLRVVIEAAGDALVEVVPSQELQEIAIDQARKSAGRIHGTTALVVLPEGSTGEKVVGRFGWKAQHGSLISASADALRNELGIPNKFFSSIQSGSFHAEPLRSDDDVIEIVGFLRSIEPVLPSTEQGATESAKAGSRLFDTIGCSTCHVRTLMTAHTGTRLNEGTLIVPAQLGSKVFHPFSDYLLHNVGTGDGLVQNVRPEDYDLSTANKFRTAPLWGLRFRSWLMHDGQSVTYHQAIMRHAGEASGVVRRYSQLTPVQKEQLRQFLESL